MSKIHITIRRPIQAPNGMLQYGLQSCHPDLIKTELEKLASTSGSNLFFSNVCLKCGIVDGKCLCVDGSESLCLLYVGDRKAQLLAIAFLKTASPALQRLVFKRQRCTTSSREGFSNYLCCFTRMTHGKRKAHV